MKKASRKPRGWWVAVDKNEHIWAAGKNLKELKAHSCRFAASVMGTRLELIKVREVRRASAKKK